MTVPWEEAIDEAYQRDRGWPVKLHPVEVGCRGYVASSRSRLLWGIGVRGQAHRSTITYLAEMNERSTRCLRSQDIQLITTHTPRFDQPVVGLPLQRVSCEERAKCPMVLRYTNDDVSLW